MIDLRQRSTVPEYMDAASLEGADVVRALKELEYVNRFLGGSRATLRAVETCLRPEPGKVMEILDLGTGAGDIPVAIVRWARSRGIDVRIVAVDFNPAICAWSGHRLVEFPEIEVRQADVFALPFAPASFDYVHCAMFLHHFAQTEAAHILQIMHSVCRQGLIVNDLHRHAMAFHTIKWMTQLLSRSAMVKHDAPVSVLRGFRRSDLEELGRLSGINGLSIKRSWPFRFVITALK